MDIRMMRIAEEIIIDKYEEELVDKDLTITQLFATPKYKKLDLKNEFRNILRERHIEVDDDCVITEEDANITFKQLYNHLCGIKEAL